MRRESSLWEKGTIHWTSFQFPPKKAMKLDEILNMSVREDSIPKTKAALAVIKKLQEKAVDFGIMDKAKPPQYFYHTDEQQDQAIKELLKQPESLKRFMTAKPKNKNKRTKRALSKIENLKINQS